VSEERLKKLEFTIARVEREQKSLKREVRQMNELLDTIASPPWKRVIFFLQGFRLWRVGRWYRKTKELH
jgi:hypothetical protein